MHHKERCTESEVLAGAQAMKTAGISKGGKSCGHFHDKTAKPINELLAPFEDLTCCPYIILIEGVPGIGKTIMSKEIAFQWANKDLLKTKKLLFLLFLRDPMVKNIKNVQSLVKYFCHTESLATKISEWLIETGGEYLIIVFDGYDEMSEENGNFHIIDSIINRQTLPKCGVIVTSRPVFSVHLHVKVSCRAEILGFSREDQQSFIQNALKGKNDKIKGLKGFLQSNPSLNVLWYIPLNMSILLYLTIEGINELPKTQTGLYQKFILMTIVHFLRKGKMVSNTTISSLDNLPHPYKQIFNELSQFAFLALQKNQIVFTSAELQSQYPNLNPVNWGPLGLLKRAQYFKPQDGCDHESFHFLHYSIQEYMAAYYIASLPDNELLQLLKKKFWDVHYFNTWVMYVGITGGKHFMFTHFLTGNYFQICSKLFGNQKISSTILSSKVKCLHLLRCATEAEHEMLSPVQNIFQDVIIDLSNQFLSVNDIRTLAELLLKLPRKKWKKLDISGCGINSEACNLLCELVLPNHETLRVTTVDISDNHFHWESLNQLCKVLSLWKVKELIMSHEVLHDSATVNMVNKFKKTLQMKLLEVGTMRLPYPPLQNVLLTYLPEKNKMIAVYTCCSCTMKCHLYNNCKPNDKLAEEIVWFILRNKRPKGDLPVVNVNFNIPSDLANEKLSIISSYFRHCDFIFKELHMHSKGILLLNHLSGVISTDTESVKLLADLVMATIVHSHSHCSKSYLKAIPVPFARQAKELLQDYAGIEHICASNTSLNCKVAIDLATVLSYNTNLKQLCLGGNNLQSTGAIKIVQGLQNISTLTSLILGDDIDKEAAGPIASILYQNSNLETLRLSRNNFQTVGAIKIAKALQYTSTLTTFGIAENDINKEAADDIASVLCHNTKLQELQVGGNNLQAVGTMKIAKALQHTATLTKFGIAGNSATEEAADDIATALSLNTKLKKLNLSDNNLKAIGVIKIAKALENNPCTGTLTDIDVSNNNIGMDEAAATKIEAVLYRCHDLSELKLSGNNLQGMSTIKIVKSLQKLSWLRIINLSNNSISAEAADDIAAAISHKKYLYKLDLSENNFQAVGIIKISKALQNTSNLVELNFSSNSINDEAAGDIAAALSHNNKL